MCGRFTLALSLEDLKTIVSARYDILSLDLSNYTPRYNIAPSQPVLSIINDGSHDRLGHLKWGLVPPFADDQKVGYALINAKAETLVYKQSFKPSLEKRRCLILADGFYEWQKTDRGKIPHRFIIKDEPLMAFAGLWSIFTTKDGQKLYTCAIVTTRANNIMAPIHDRMPVILSREQQKIWLNPRQQDLQLLTSLLRPYEEKIMARYQVKTAVNNPFVDYPELIER